MAMTMSGFISNAWIERSKTTFFVRPFHSQTWKWKENNNTNIYISIHIMLNGEHPAIQASSQASYTFLTGICIYSTTMTLHFFIHLPGTSSFMNKGLDFLQR